MIRRVGLIAALGAAAGAPYLATETEFGRSVTSTVTGALDPDGTTGGGSATSGGTYANHAHYETESLRRDDLAFRYEEQLARKLGALPADPRAAPSLVGSQVRDLREVLRFDISDTWVTSRFARVSTISANLNLEAFRVPIVTGTQTTDLAGTLTYYFDNSGTVQRITVHGFTGNPNQLIQTMTSFYGLRTEPNLEAGVYTRRWNGTPVHFLRLTHAPVVYADAVHQKYTVFLELNQPNLSYGISAEAQIIVQSDKHSGRW